MKGKGRERCVFQKTFRCDPLLRKVSESRARADYELFLPVKKYQAQKCRAVRAFLRVRILALIETFS